MEVSKRPYVPPEKFTKQVVWTGSATSVDLETLPGGDPGPGLYCVVVNGSPSQYIYGPAYKRPEPSVSGDINSTSATVGGGIASDTVSMIKVQITGLNATIELIEDELTISTSAITRENLAFNEIWKVSEA